MKKLAILSISALGLTLFFSVHLVWGQNFVGPQTSAGVGQGAIGVDSSNNLAIGTSTPQSDTKLLIVGTSTTGGYFAIKVLDMNRGPLFIVRSDGSVSIGSPYVQSNQTGSTTTVSGVGTAPSNGALFVNGPIFTTLDLKASGGISVGTTTPQSGGNIYATGSITAGTISGSYSGTISAANTSAGAFGSNTGGGNYSFPASVGIGTTAPGGHGSGAPGPYLDLYGASGGPEMYAGQPSTSADAAMAVWGGYNSARNARLGYMAFENDGSNAVSANGRISFWTNNAGTLGERLRIDKTGNVGIGTTDPSSFAKFAIRGGITASINSGSFTGVSFETSDAVNSSFYINHTSGVVNLISDTGMSIYTANGAGGIPAERVRILNTGNVGIGTTSPAYKLTVASGEVGLDSTNRIYWGANTSVRGTTGNALAITTGAIATDVVTINSTGNVGIGTTAPSSTLTVAGAIRTTSVGVIFPDNTTQSTAYLGGTQTIVAGNVSAGAFGSNTGNGNYSFPGTLTVTGALSAGATTITTTAGTGLLLVNNEFAIGTGGKIRFDGIHSPSLTQYTGPSLAAAKETASYQTGLAFSTVDNAGGISERVRIDGNGNVGIGTTTPVEKLSILSGDNTTSNILAVRANNLSQGVGLWFGGVKKVGTTVNSDLDIDAAGTGNIILNAGNGGTGNVGIGTTGPNDALHVYRAYDSAGSTGANAATIFIDGNIGQDSWLGWGTAGVAKMVAGIDNGGNSVNFWGYSGGWNLGMAITTSGNVGIGTTAPSSTLHVVGTASFSQPITVGTPTATGHAATKSYVDSTVGGSIGGTAANALACSGDATCEMSGANLQGGNIVGVNKLTVTTIDPVYEINGKKYSTYAASFAGGVKEEYAGKAKLRSGNTRINADNKSVEADTRGYEYVIDFDKVETGSDLWVWYKAIDFSRDNVEAIATPYGQTANIWYEIEANKIIFHGDKPAEFSFRLTGKRFDWQKWPTLAPDQTEKTSLIIN